MTKGDRSGEWVSVPAVLWVLDDAPDVPPALVATLIGLARHAHDDGSNTYPSEATLAKYTRKSVRQVRRDLAELLKRGLIRRPDDQSATYGYRADRRPTVYDLACAPDRDNDRSPTTGRPRPPGHPRPVVGDRTTGHAGQNDRSPTSAEEALKKPEKAAAARARELSTGEVDVLALARRLGITPGDAETILTEIRRKSAPRNLAAYVASIPDAELLDRLLARDDQRDRSATPVPPVCGQCDARDGDPVSARVVWRDADRTASDHCPRCHPAANQASQALAEIREAP